MTKALIAAQDVLKDLLNQQSKERGTMAGLAVVDELTDEQRAELDKIEKGTPDLERKIRAARVAVEDAEKQSEVRGADEDGVDAEMRERLELRSKARLTSFFVAASRGRAPDGAEAELQAAANVSGIPLELWETPRRERRAEAEGEQRAVTPAPGTTGVNLDVIQPAVFAASIAPRLGIEMPRVPSGTYATGTITGSQDAAALAKGAPIAAAAGAITVATAIPKRVSARLELSLEDIAAIGQDNFEAVLRENVSLALSDELDKQAINGDGQGANLTGLFARLDDPAAPAAEPEDWGRFLAIQASGIDGLWASMLSEVNLLVGVETYRRAATTFQGDDAEQSAAAYMTANGGGFWTNKRMPVKNAHIQQGILYRSGRSMMGGSMTMRTAVCPHWGEVTIDDIYSGAAKAERSFTMHVLLGDVILTQKDAYSQVAFRVSK